MRKMRQISENNSRNPRANATTPANSPFPSGHPKLRFKLSVEIFRHASSGPTPVKNKSRSLWRRGVFDWVQAPVTAPSEHRVRPMRAQHDSAGLEHPGDHRPLARQVNPLLARVACEEGTQRKRKRYRKSRIP